MSENDNPTPNLPLGRVLIIDDTLAIHEDFRKVFCEDQNSNELHSAELNFFGQAKPQNNALNYDLVSAHQGEEGYELVKESVRIQKPFSLAFVDMRMPPGWDGVETIKHLWEVDPSLQIVICTAYSDYSWCDIIEHFGHSDQILILKKPFDNLEVSQLVTALTAKRRLLDQSRLYTSSLQQRVRDQTRTIRLAHEETIHRLVQASMFRDKETGAHIRRVGLFSAIVARAVGWSDIEVDQIRMAAPMHDVGKIGISDSILQKPGPLTDDERTIMQSHTVIGYELLANSASPMLQMACKIALHHHEHWNGAGYPSKLQRLEIPMAARIVGIVDFYDALSQDRVYRPACLRDEVLKLLGEGRGTHFDPDLLDLFFELLPEIEAVGRKNLDDAEAEKSPQLPAKPILPKQRNPLRAPSTFNICQSTNN